MNLNSERIIESLKEIEINKPVDLIISQIRSLISSGVVKPGDKLPPERELAQRMRIGRGYVREALKRLEFYGILQTIPHKGTIVARLGVNALVGLISNVLQIERNDFTALVETRLILETSAVRLTAERASPAEITQIQQAHDEYRRLAQAGLPSLDVDFLFHLRIAEFCQNAVLRSIIALISPDIIAFSQDVTHDQAGYKLLSEFVVQEHQAIMHGIVAQNPDAAATAMHRHLSRILKLVRDSARLKEQFNIFEWIQQYKSEQGIG
jgi:GntR family transcriptional repressor for pyruvate dehydrogenase complex